MINPKAFEMYDAEEQNKERKKIVSENDRFADLFPEDDNYKKNSNNSKSSSNKNEVEKKKSLFSKNVDKKYYELSDKVAEIMLPNDVHPAFKEAIKVGIAYVLQDYIKK